MKFIAPKGVEESGAVQFKIEAEVILDTEYFVRAGYSANASIITAKRENDSWGIFDENWGFVIHDIPKKFRTKSKYNNIRKR